jgi:hypothetical protein
MRSIRLAALCAAAVALGSVGVGHAAQNRHVSILMRGQITSATTVDGTFELRGWLTDQGTYHEDFRIVGARISATKTFVGAMGTFVLRIHCRVTTISDTQVGFAGGRWWLESGTGAYAGLRGGGDPAVAPGSISDLATGQVRIRHSGSLRPL